MEKEEIKEEKMAEAVDGIPKIDGVEVLEESCTSAPVAGTEIKEEVKGEQVDKKEKEVGGEKREKEAAGEEERKENGDEERHVEKKREEVEVVEENLVEEEVAKVEDEEIECEEEEKETEEEKEGEEQNRKEESEGIEKDEELDEKMEDGLDGEEVDEKMEEDGLDGEEVDEKVDEGEEEGDEKVEDDQEEKGGKVEEEDELSEKLEQLEINPEEDTEKIPEREPAPEPEIVETPEERIQRLKDFYDVEFARPDLEPQGGKNFYVIIKYENYQRPLGTVQEQREAPKKRAEINEGNAKIAEYFGEDLNSDEEFDQLLKQFTDAAITEGSEGAKPGSDQVVVGDKVSDIPENSTEKVSGRNKEKPTFDTILEENENQVIPDTVPAKKDKSKAEKRKKSNEVISSKVHIRHFPPNMRKEEFLEAIGPLPEYNYLHFTSGAFMSRVCNRKCTGFCHINFVRQEDADAFVSSYRIFIIRDERGDECYGSAEFAINQRLPKIPSVLTYDPGALYDMPNEVKYKDFRQSYDANATGILGVPVNPDGTVTADVMINEIEEKNTHKNELQTTPLLAYIIAQAKSEKEKKYGHSVKKGSDKSRITIKKERKRDRRDRRDRKEKDKDKEKVKSTKEGDHNKAENKETSRQSDRKIKQRNPDKPRKPDNVNSKASEAAPADKGSQPPEVKQDNRDKKPNADVLRDKVDSESKKDRKLTSPPKKFEKRNNEKRSSGPGKSDSRQPKPDVASSTSKPVKPEKPNDNGRTSYHESSKAGNSEAVGNSAADQDKSGGRKKTVKKIVKVKKVVKKGEEAGSTSSTGVQEKKEVSSANNTSTDAQPKTKSVEGSRGESGATHSHDNSAHNDTKRTKKARPDMQIYRPGSLRNKGTDSKAGAGDNTPKKEKDKTGEAKGASKEVKSSDKVKHGDS